MNRNICNTIVFSLILVFASCSSNVDEAAQARLDTARKLYHNEEFDLAKAEIDSLKKLHPKALKELKEGLVLLDSVRRAGDIKIIQSADSVLAVNEPKIDSMKKLFVLSKNSKYQDIGIYSPKETPASGALTATTLRSGVSEEGQLYLESVFIGAQKHNKLRVTTPDGQSCETMAVTDDGLNYRFETLGKYFETIRFSGSSENNVAEFITQQADKKLTVHLEGGSKNSYILSAVAKNAIGKSFRLSQVMQQSDSLRLAKDKATVKLHYLQNKKEINQLTKEIREESETVKDTAGSDL